MPACVAAYLPATGYTDEFLRGIHIQRARTILRAHEQRVALQATVASCKARGLQHGVVTIGMPAATVLECGWGRPAHTRKTTTSAGVAEVWTYAPGRTWLTLKNGTVESITE